MIDSLHEFILLSIHRISISVCYTLIQIVMLTNNQLPAFSTTTPNDK